VRRIVVRVPGGGTDGTQGVFPAARRAFEANDADALASSSNPEALHRS
jgi:hypothetical protein